MHSKGKVQAEEKNLAEEVLCTEMIGRKMEGFIILFGIDGQNDS